MVAYSSPRTGPGSALLLTLGLLTGGTHGASAQPALADAPVEFVTLGTGGGPIVFVERSRPANAVVVGQTVYLFDVGDGVQRQLAAAKLPLAKVRAVFISHHHPDHNADLGPVLVTRWSLYDDSTAMPVIGPPGTVELVGALAAANRATALAPLTDYDYAKPPLDGSVAPRDLPAVADTPRLVYEDENLRVSVITNTHYHFPAGSEEAEFSRTYAYRIETARRTIVYTGDTGPSEHVELLARGADLLVSEVIDLKKIETALEKSPLGAGPGLEPTMAHMRDDHVTGAQVGQLAQRAGVREVVLTHFSPGADGETDLSGYTDSLDVYFRGPVHLARDLDRW